MSHIILIARVNKLMQRGVLSFGSYQGRQTRVGALTYKHPLAPGCRAVLYLLHIVIIYLFIHPTWTSRVLFHKHRFEGFFFTSPPFRCWSFQDQASSFSKIYQNWKASNTAAAV